MAGVANCGEMTKTSFDQWTSLAGTLWHDILVLGKILLLNGQILGIIYSNAHCLWMF
jgi:hypothetical protein